MDPSIARLMNAVEDGEASAADALFSALYAELHRLAKRELGRPGAAVSLSPTTLLHEAYLECQVVKELRFLTDLGSWDMQPA